MECVERIEDKVMNRLRKIVENGYNVWSIGFSGGKDSTTLLSITINYILSSRNPKPKKVIVLYADTLLEYKPMRDWARSVIDRVNLLANRENLPIEAHICEPAHGWSLLEAIVYKGYPAPSPLFRWCTDKLKIKPARQKLQEILKNIINSHRSVLKLAILSGVRGDEATHRAARSKRLGPPGSVNPIMTKDSIGGTAFAPLQDLNESDVWRYLENSVPPWGDTYDPLLEIYGRTLNIDFTPRYGCCLCPLIKEDTAAKVLIMLGELDENDYELLNEWKDLYLKVCRKEPHKWRMIKKTVCKKNGSRWKYTYSSLNYEARKLLYDKIWNIARSSRRLRELLASQLARISNPPERCCEPHKSHASYKFLY